MRIGGNKESPPIVHDADGVPLDARFPSTVLTIVIEPAARRYSGAGLISHLLCPLFLLANRGM